MEEVEAPCRKEIAIGKSADARELGIDGPKCGELCRADPLLEGKKEVNMSSEE